MLELVTRIKFSCREGAMSKYKKIILISTGVIAALILFTMAILPYIVRSKAIVAIEDATGRKVHIEKIAINPFTLAVTVTGLAIEEKGGGPFVSIGELHASLGLASIFKRALILSEVSIDKPSISMTRLAANSYNFNDIIERQKAKPKQESKGEFRFSINNISLTNGSTDFNDLAVNGGRKHTVRDLKITIPFISNIPYLVEKYTDPHISAVVNGAPFTFSGKVKPLSKSMETSVHIGLKQLSLPEYVAYVPVKPPADLASGFLTIDADVSYRISAAKKPELAVKGLVKLDGVAVNLKNGQPLLKLPKFQVKASNLEVFARRFLFDAISVDGMELFANRSAGGEWMYRQLLPQSAKVEKKPEAVPEKKTEGDKKDSQLVLQIASFVFSKGIVHLNDAQPKGGFKGDITQIDAAVKNFTTGPDKAADYELSLLFDDDATFSVDGTFSLTPLTATASTELSGLKLQRGWPYLSQFLTAPVKGAIDLAAEASYSKENGLIVEQGSILATGLSARYGDKEGFDLARFEINGAGYRQKENAVNAAEIKLSQGKLSLSRELDGSISLLSLLKKPQGGAATTATRPKAAAKAGQKDVSFRLGKIQIDRFTTAFIDKTREERPRFVLRNTSLSLANLNGPKFKPSPFSFTSTFNKATPIKARGILTPNPFRYKGSVSVGRLPLRDFEAYFPSNLNVFILGGFADTTMNVDVALKEGKPTGSFKGSAGIRAFHAIDTVEEEDLLKWESLQLDEIKGNLEPFSLSLRQIALNGVYSRIIVRKDGTLNLQNLVEKPKQEAAATPAAPISASAAKPVGPPVVAPVATPVAAVQQQPGAGKKQISVGEVTIQEGTMSFTDNHLPQHFATTFYNLGGRVSGLSSEDAKFADVDLRGNLENHSPLQITGQINPLRDDLFVDLKVSFRDIELSPVTPYSGTYLGYTVEKGKLFLDLKYRIDKKQLDSSNNIFIDQFTFGEKVESDKATKLPVKLGLALLKDRKGEIHLDVPVTGRTDDPKFSIWRLVFQVLRNLMVKAATSPFSLLSSMFGGGHDFSAIQFNHGTSILSSQEEQKLTTLSKLLLDRPALKVELKGYVDREKDGEGFRRELLDRKMRYEKFLALSKQGIMKEGEKAETIQIMSEEYPKYLAVVYKKEKFPKPRNFLGLVKDIPPDEMKKLIITNTVVGEPELQLLARERVVAVLNYLVRKGNIPAERVFQKNDDLFKAPEKETASRSRVELNAIAQ
jgi:hypothetical protein